ncbi:MAG: hypothetical protein ACRDAU_10180 [Clostridium sp.]
MRKRRGSAVLTILAVSMVLMLLGGILLNVIMSTTKGNENSNRRQDLKYGAEGGIEIARSYLAENGYSATAETEINKNAEILTEAKTPESNVTKMEIELNEIGNVVEIVSKAKYEKDGKSNEEKLKCKIIKGHDGNFMDHGLVGGDGGVQMSDSGSVNLEETSVSTGNDGVAYPPIKPGDPSNSIKPPLPENEHKNNFGKLQHKPTIRKSEVRGNLKDLTELEFSSGTEVINVKEVKMEFKVENDKTVIKIVGDNQDPKVYLQGLENTVIKLELANGAVGDNLHDFAPKIYIINSEKFNMNFNNTLRIYNAIIINSGDMSIDGEGTLDMQNSTFIANKIETGMNVAFHIKGQPNKVDNNGYGVFSEEEEIALNELLDILIPNWGENNTGGSDEHIVIEDGSFE